MSEMTRTLNEDKTASFEVRSASIDDMMQQVNEVVSYATNILNNVLDLSKIKSDKSVLKKQDFDLQDLAARATTMQLAKAVKAKMKFVPSPQPCIANSDKDIATRILTNLISNAVKFTTEGAIQPFVGPLHLLQQDGEALYNDLRLNGTKARMIAVGVADTGPGLSQEILDAAKTGVLDSVSGGDKCHGACNSGFGLHLCQTLAESLGTELYLSNLDDAWELLSDDMKNAAFIRKLKLRGRPCTSTGAPGTVLYFTLPVYDDKLEAQLRLDTAKEAEMIQKQDSWSSDQENHFIFRPGPAPDSKDGSFRILIADDVLMLRKGLLNTLSTIFTECPVSISTASSAEDMLRAAAVNPFDLIICDNLFRHESANMKTLSPEEEGEHGRPRLHFDRRSTTRAELRTRMADFFQNERFTVREGDGELLGVNAVIQLSRTENPTFPIPLLMLLSGHTIDIPDSLGIIVAQKPLKQSDFCALLEAAAPFLLKTNQCSYSIDVGTNRGLDDSSSSQSDSSSVILYNRHGSPIFEQISAFSPK